MREDQPPSPGWASRIKQCYASFRGQIKTREDLLCQLRAAAQNQIIDLKSLNMIEGVLQVSDITVEEIMVPRGQMVMIDENGGLDKIHRTVTDSGHSRFPVIDEEQDKVVGIVLAKDLLKWLGGNDESFDLDDIRRPVSFIPESKKLDTLLKEFRDSRNHMAIVGDEFGSVSGLVTIEDVLEQIVGEIDDEHDPEDHAQSILAKGDGKYMIRALTPVEDFNRYFESKLPDEEYDTIGGLVTSYFGRLPERDETVRVDDYRFRVVNADARRIRTLEMSTTDP